jgi:DHA3 family macrolide efflux protein-like MFS transporter
MTIEKHRLGGVAGFTIVWLGQIVSVLASGMTQFALTIWMYQQTSSATALGLMQVFYITPFLVISPIAGVMVDRYNRKLMMMVSDLAAGMGTIMVLVLQSQGKLEFWMLYIVSALIGLGGAFQWPAYSAAISTMVPKEQYGRVNGMMTLMEAGPGVLAPLLAGMFLPIIGLTGILAFDVITFVLAIGALLIVYIPQPPKTVEGQKESGNFFKEALYGFTYIFARPSLLGLQLVFLFGNLFAGIGYTVLAPMVLEHTSNNAAALGAVMTAGAVGAVVGGVGMSIWGGFKRRVHGVLGGWILSGLGFAMLGLGQTLPIWVFFSAFSSMVGPLVNASNQSIWMAKVAPDVQGRVFSARRLIAWSTQPITPIIGGLLADFVLEPAMMGTGTLATVFGPLVGNTSGSGMSLLIFLCGLGAAAVGAAGYYFNAIRNAEDILPDHDTLARVEPDALTA